MSCRFQVAWGSLRKEEDSIRCQVIYCSAIERAVNLQRWHPASGIWHLYCISLYMTTAKIIRHRHKYHHYLNDDLKSVKEETHFKIIFSDPTEMEKFKKWCKANEGEYDYDKDNSCQRGSIPQIEAFKDEICWCDIMAFYLLHVAGYSFYSTIHPYKGEVYIKQP